MPDLQKSVTEICRSDNKQWWNFVNSFLGLGKKNDSLQL